MFSCKKDLEMQNDYLHIAETDNRHLYSLLSMSSNVFLLKIMTKKINSTGSSVAIVTKRSCIAGPFDLFQYFIKKNLNPYSLTFCFIPH